SNNAFRSAGHLQYTFLDTESGFFTFGTYLAKKKVLTVGGGYDAQSDYKAFAGDAFFDHPLGTKYALTVEGDYIHYDGGTTFTDLLKQNDWLAQAGFLFTKPKLMPWVKLEGQKFSNAADTSKDLHRFQVGLSYFHLGQNVNVKAGYGRINPKT